MKKMDEYEPTTINEISYDKRTEIASDFSEIRWLIHDINEKLVKASTILHGCYEFVHDEFAKHFSEPRCFEITELLERMISDMDDKISPLAYAHGKSEFIDDHDFYSTYQLGNRQMLYYTTNPSYVNKFIQFYGPDMKLSAKPYTLLQNNTETIFSNVKMVYSLKGLFQNLLDVIKKNKGFGGNSSIY